MTGLLDDLVTYIQTSQLRNNLEDKSKNLLLPTETPLLEPQAIDLKLFNKQNFLKKIHKFLSRLATPLPETLTIELKQLDENNSLDEKRNFSSISSNILKICYVRVDSSKWASMLNRSLFLKLLSSNKKGKKRWAAVIWD